MHSDEEESNCKRMVEGGDAVIRANLHRVNDKYSQRVLIQRLTKVKDAGWWICVGMPEENRILAIKKIFFQNSTRKELKIVLPEKLEKSMYFYLLSDTYNSIDQ
jgi:hypothetical protein